MNKGKISGFANNLGLNNEVQHECSKEFRTAKRKHPAVESGINALGVHGLGKCLDHGLIGFKRYVAMA